MRVLARMQPRDTDEEIDQNIDKLAWLLQNLDGVRLAEDLGREAGFEDPKTCVKHIAELTERTGTVLRKPYPKPVVARKGLPDDEFWRQVESLPQRPPRKRRSKAKKPESQEPTERPFRTDFD
jgi:hypothetical protein